MENYRDAHEIHRARSLIKLSRIACNVVNVDILSGSS